MKYGLVLLLLTCLSCGMVAKKIKKVKSPRLETPSSVNAYLQSYNLDTTEVFVFRNLMAFATASEAKYLSFPNAYFFNAEGFAVEYPKTAENCNAQVGSFISDLKDFSNWPAEPSRTISNFTKLLQPDFVKQPADITVFITFTTYSGKLNDEKAFEWIALLNKAKQNGVSVNYYLVSADFMKSWNIPESLRKKWGIKK